MKIWKKKKEVPPIKYLEYASLQQIGVSIEPVVSSGMPLSSGEFEHIVKETIRLLGKEK